MIRFDRKEAQYEATDTEESDSDYRQPVEASPPETPDPSTVEETKDPHDVATCDPKYWACPGANGLKVSASFTIPSSAPFTILQAGLC